MPVTIDQVTAQQFGRSIYLLSQQKGSKFASKVRNESVANAEAAYFDTLASDEDTSQKTGRHQGTPETEPNFGRRKVVPYPWTNKKVLDKEDLDRMATDPTNMVVQNQANALGKKKDDLIIAAALGTAQIGKVGATSISFAADSLSINGDGTVTTLGTAAAPNTQTNISLATILTMMQIFNEADVDPDIQKYWAVSPNDLKEMLDIQELTSADYNTVRSLVNGKVESFAGFNFFWSNRLQTDTTEGTCWRTIAWAEDGIILASIGDIASRIQEVERLDYAWTIFSKMDLGAVRMEGAKVHECLTSKVHV